MYNNIDSATATKYFNILQKIQIIYHWREQIIYKNSLQSHELIKIFKYIKNKEE